MFAFSYCSNLKSFEIPTNSKLQIIDEKAFYSTQIERFFIPSHLIRICEGAFCLCKKLKKIDFQENSELQTIEKKSIQFNINN